MAENEKLNVKIELIRVDKKTEKPSKSGTSKAGKSWTMWPVGIQSGGIWYNASIFSTTEYKKFTELKTDKSIYLKTFVEEYEGSQYNKFEFLKDADKLELRISRVQKFMKFYFEQYPEEKILFDKL